MNRYFRDVGLETDLSLLLCLSSVSSCKHLEQVYCMDVIITLCIFLQLSSNYSKLCLFYLCSMFYDKVIKGLWSNIWPWLAVNAGQNRPHPHLPLSGDPNDKKNKSNKINQIFPVNMNKKLSLCRGNTKYGKGAAWISCRSQWKCKENIREALHEYRPESASKTLAPGWVINNATNLVQIVWGIFLCVGVCYH